MTQWLSACRCDSAPLPLTDVEATEVCAVCKKRIVKGRSGSLTQWVFRSDSCSCALDSVAPETASETGSTGVTTFSPEVELELDPATFPTERYKPLSEIGRGAEGIVYLCRDRLLAKKVAVKCLRKVGSEDLISFQKEAKATCNLNHPGIVSVMDFGVTSSGAPYMVMNYASGLSCDRFLAQNGPMDIDLFTIVFSQIASALEYAHSRKVFHRDVKSSNILILEDPGSGVEARIIDFGTAAVKQQTQTSITAQGRTIVGTPAYMPPDQVQGLTYDARSEIYALGCVMFEALTGSVPFQGETALETLSLHAHAQPPTLSEAREDLEFHPIVENLVNRCLSKDPDKRPQSMAEVASTLNNLSDEQSSPASFQYPEIENRARKKKKHLITAPAFWIIAGLLVSTSYVAFLAIRPVNSGRPQPKIEAIQPRSVFSKHLQAGDLRHETLADAESALHSHDPLTAARIANRLLLKDKKNYAAFRIRGIANVLNGEYSFGVEDLTLALDHIRASEPGQGEALYYRAIAYRRSGEKLKSQEDFSAAKKAGFRPSASESNNYGFMYSTRARGRAQITVLADKVTIKGGRDWVLKDASKGIIRKAILSDTVLNVTAIKNLQHAKVKELILSRCSLENLEDLKLLTELDSLEIDECLDLTTDSLMKLSSLPITRIVLINLELSPKLLSGLSKWSKLRTFCTFQCRGLNSEGLLSINKSLIETIAIHSCPIKDNDLVALSQFDRFKSLKLVDCRNITGSFLKELRQIPITILVLENLAQFQSSSLQYITDMKSLRTLSMHSVSISGKAFAALKNSQLRSISLDGINFDEETFPAIAAIKSLALVDLIHVNRQYFNGFDEGDNDSLWSDNAIAELSSLPNLTTLCLNSERLHEFSFAKFRNLKTLAVRGGTKFTRRTLSTLARVPLETLVVIDQTISDSDWLQIAHCKSLRHLGLVDGPFFGALDSEYVSRLNLQELDIVRRRIPVTAFHNLAKMKTLKALRFINCSYNSADLKWLQAALPGCMVSSGDVAGGKNHMMLLKAEY